MQELGLIRKPASFMTSICDERGQELNYAGMPISDVSYLSFEICNNISVHIYVVGPCHHGMARPQVADRGTASDKEGSCE